MDILPKLPKLEDVDSPSKLGKAFLKAAQRYYYPKTYIGFFLVFQFIQPAMNALTSSVLYPSPEEYMKRQGLPASLVDRATPSTPAFVKPVPQERRIIDWVHALAVDYPTSAGTLVSAYLSGNRSDGMTRPGVFCHTYLTSPDQFDTKAMMAAYFLRIRKSSMRDLPVSDKDIHLAFTIHEFGHCDAQKNLPGFSNAPAILPEFMTRPFFSDQKMVEFSTFKNMKETHSDRLAIQIFEETHKNTNIRAFMLAFRSISPAYILSPDFDINHDDALRLDAENRGLPDPSMEDILESRKEVSDLILGEMEKREKIKREDILGKPWHITLPDFSYDIPLVDNDDWGVRFLRVANSVLNENSSTLSPLAKRRLELYIDGFRYFAPTVVEAALSPTQKKLSAPTP